MLSQQKLVEQILSAFFADDRSTCKQECRKRMQTSLLTVQLAEMQTIWFQLAA